MTTQPADEQPTPAPRLDTVDPRDTKTATATDSFRIVVLGDIHIYRPTYNPLRLLSKRLAAQVNQWVNPHRKFHEQLLRPTLAYAATLEPDLVLLTGDLTVSALPAEFIAVGEAVREAFGGTRALALPGNHDRYTHGSMWARTMERCLPGWVPTSFPYVAKLSSSVGLIALDAAAPNPISARGKVGRRQLEAVTGQYVWDAHGGATVLVACHYPFDVPAGTHHPWGHHLADADDVRRHVAQWAEKVAERVIYLHGHVHKGWQFEPIPGAPGVLDVNAGAPTRVNDGCPYGQGFLSIDVPAGPGGEVAIQRHVRGGGPGDSPAWRSHAVP